jgi:hypothetical protein
MLRKTLRLTAHREQAEKTEEDSSLRNFTERILTKNKGHEKEKLHFSKSGQRQRMHVVRKTRSIVKS